MSILDLHEEALGTAAAATRSLPSVGGDSGLFKGFAEGAGRYFMRGMAEAGRAASMSFAAVPVLLQKGIDATASAVGDKTVNSSRLDDSYFRWHDETFNNAVDHWTPKPNEIGAAGQVVGTLGAGVVQFMANPALMIGTAQQSTAEDLVRQGVDSGAALVAGDFAGIFTSIGVKIPMIGQNLAQRVAAGMGGNVAQGVAQTAATRAVLTAADAPPDVLKQFETWDVRNRTVDSLMGAAFGAIGHVSAKGAADTPPPREALTQTQRDAVMVVNAARHIEETAAPGRPATPADLTAAVERTKTALDQMLRGEPVSVEGVSRETPDPIKAAEREQIAALVTEHAPPEAPIERPPMAAPDAAPAEPGSKPAEAAPPPRFDDSVMLPTGHFDPKTGEPLAISANEHIANALADAEGTKTTAPNLLATAAECLLGNL